MWQSTNEDFHSSSCAVKRSQRTITNQNLVPFLVHEWISDNSAVSYIFSLDYPFYFLTYAGLGVEVLGVEVLAGVFWVGVFN